VTVHQLAAGTLMSRGALVFQAEDIQRLLYLPSCFCIYCLKNEEYCLDIASLECLRHSKRISLG
jgi:hypothetical protein